MRFFLRILILRFLLNLDLAGLGGEVSLHFRHAELLQLEDVVLVITTAA